MDKEKAKAAIQSASARSVAAKAGAIRAQYTNEATPRCLHHGYHGLARAVGLSDADIPALRAWVVQQGLAEPRRATKA